MESEENNQQPNSHAAASVDVHRLRQGVVHVVLLGEHDMASAARLEEAINEASIDASYLVVDVTRTDFLDSTTLHVIWEAARSAEKNGHQFAVIVEGKSIVKRVFEITGLLGELPVADSLSDALTARAAQRSA